MGVRLKLAKNIKPQLLLGRCEEVLPTLASESVMSIVTDPPYGQSNESYDRGTSDTVWRECFRIAAANAVLLALGGSPTYHRMASSIENAGWRVRQMWAWVFRDGLITSAWPKEGFDRLAPAMTPICYATKGKILLNLEREGSGWSLGVDKRTHKPSWSGRTNSPGRASAAGHYPRSLVASDGIDGFQYFILSHRATPLEEDVRHPNQKPLPLLHWLLGKLPPGGTCLDPYMGSGTTGVACVQSGRDFIGIECDPVYHEMASNRVAKAVMT